VHVFGVHVRPTHTLKGLQNWLEPHGGQFWTAPHPSVATPHCAPTCAQVCGVQLAAPQTFGAPPPPHVWPGWQSPQWMLPPQPSGQSPQFLPDGHADSGVQGGAPQWLATPPPPHV
jgi:hypothetical protein